MVLKNKVKLVIFSAVFICPQTSFGQNSVPNSAETYLDTVAKESSDIYGNNLRINNNKTDFNKRFGLDITLNGKSISVGSATFNVLGMAHPVDDAALSKFVAAGNFQVAILTKQFGDFCEYSVFITLEKDVFRRSTLDKTPKCAKARAQVKDGVVVIKDGGDVIANYPIIYTSNVKEGDYSLDPSISLDEFTRMLSSVYMLYEAASFCVTPETLQTYRRDLKERALKLEMIFQNSPLNDKINEAFRQQFSHISSAVLQERQSAGFDEDRFCAGAVGAMDSYYEKYFYKLPKSTTGGTKPW